MTRLTSTKNKNPKSKNTLCYSDDRTENDILDYNRRKGEKPQVPTKDELNRDPRINKQTKQKTYSNAKRAKVTRDNKQTKTQEGKKEERKCGY